MGDFFKFYNIKSLNLVEVREYCGIEGNRHAWIFLGYDVVRTDENGKAISVLDEEQSKYDYLNKINLSDVDINKSYNRGIDYFDHERLVVGDIRAKVLENGREKIFGKKSIVSVFDIKNMINKQNGLYFLHQSEKKNIKVKEKRK